MRVNPNIFVWLGCSLFAGFMAFVTLHYSLATHKFEFHPEGDRFFFPLITSLSAGLAGWLRKLHKGTDDFMGAGALTWIFFTLALMLWLVGGVIYDWNTSSNHDIPNIAASIIVGILFFSTPISLPAATVSTLIVMAVMFLIRKTPKLFIKKNG